MFDFDIPLRLIPGIGKEKATVLNREMNISKANDLLHFFPNRYIDRSRFYKISELNSTSTEIQLKGLITMVDEIKQKNRIRLVANFSDETGNIQLIWFRFSKWLKSTIKINESYILFGKVNFFNGQISIAHPNIELEIVYNNNLKSGFQAIYPSTEKMNSKKINNRFISKQIKNLIENSYHDIDETLSDTLLKSLNLISKREALLHIHFPKNSILLSQAQRRLKFEELFFIQLHLIKNKRIKKEKIKGFLFEHIGERFNNFYKKGLDFELTNAQKKVLKEIRNDMRKGSQMNRLLQGDVGSGKTIVALLSMLIALDNDFQAVMVAPTEVLATQHYEKIKKLIDPFGISIKILKGASKKNERTIIDEQLKDGSLNILIGTHAIFEDRVIFKNLGISIIDEQHKFGVAQRAKMWIKNKYPPHILIMSATPIPRTLAMSLYSDMDISTIDELPIGRKPIKTVHKFENSRLSIFKFIRDKIAEGRQIYIVYPLIKESEKMDYKNLEEGYHNISREFPLPDYRISIVHGKMKSEDKDFEIQRFVKGETQIIIATTVIEVGIDIPNASVMIIESAERFGLSQLHQLRGRVGRGSEQSYCILISDYRLSNEAKIKLKTIESTNDGFQISETDLKLRGPGDLMGTQQSGIPILKIANLNRDQDALVLAREMAFDILNEDPALEMEKNQAIRKSYQKMEKSKGIWMNIS